MVEQNLADQITVLSGNNDSVTLSIDPRSHLPVKKTYSWRDPNDRMMDEESEVFSNYRLIQGIQTPLSTVRNLNGEMSNQRFMTTVTYNNNFPATMFETKGITYNPQKGARRSSNDAKLHRSYEAVVKRCFGVIVVRRSHFIAVCNSCCLALQRIIPASLARPRDAGRGCGPANPGRTLRDRRQRERIGDSGGFGNQRVERLFHPGWSASCDPEAGARRQPAGLPGTKLSVTASQSGRELMFSMNSGNLEMNYPLGASADTLLTPDLRLLMPGPGTVHVAVHVTPQGDTCVQSLPWNASAIVVSETMGDATYQVKHDEAVLFKGGHLSEAVRSKQNCGCPVSPPMQVAKAVPPPPPVGIQARATDGCSACQAFAGAFSGGTRCCGSAVCLPRQRSSA